MKLPIGMQTFSEVACEGYYYVDKTRFVARLAEEGKFYSLCRPRRFGKSLFLDTLKEAFSGNRACFKGLWLEDHWDWNTKHPVLKLSWGSGTLKSPDELWEKFDHQIRLWTQTNGLVRTQGALSDQLYDLIRSLHQSTGQKVVFLVDEYDKPILDNLARPEVAVAMRDALRNIYSVFKDADEHLRFGFLTGVSKFSKVSLFSGLNNLQDLSHITEFGTICGYTQSDLETVFADRLVGVDLEKVKLWYNGYCFGEAEGVYNPFDVLLFLREHKFRPWWFETATPTFLIELMQSGRYSALDLEHMEVGEEIFSSFEIERLSLPTILYQAGYLTLDRIEEVGPTTRYFLRYPNLEVKTSLCDYLLASLVDDVAAKGKNLSTLWKTLVAPDLDKLRTVLTSFFASIPHDWYRKNQLSNYEAYYASIVYCYFAAIGLDVRPEEVTNKGQMDMAVVLESAMLVMEFKVTDLVTDGIPALEQIERNGYHQKFMSLGKPVYLLGIEFCAQDRNIHGYNWKLATPA